MGDGAGNETKERAGSVHQDNPISTAILAALEVAGGNGIVLADLEALSISADATLAVSPDRRARLGAAIEQLQQEGVVRCPSAKGDWDRTGTPALPNWVRPPLGSRKRRVRPPGRLPGYLRPELAGARALEPLRPEEIVVLEQVNAWLVRRTGSKRPQVVPHRERSLEVFGNEKRLDTLVSSRLMESEVVTLDLLSCVWIPPQLPWKRIGTGGTALVVENAATYHSIARALSGAGGSVDLVAYGGGNAFTKTVAGLAEADAGPVNQILYFGDLDEAGIAIPMRASTEASRFHLPPPIPALELYDLLLAHGRPESVTPAVPIRAHELASWFGPAAVHIEELLLSGVRLAQEAVGTELLAEHWEALGSLGTSSIT
jgi:hypothetical protein